MISPPTAEERPHIEALKRATTAGFTPLRLPGVPGIYAERRRRGAVETYTIVAMTDAKAARWREEDYGRRGAGPLWETSGTVAEVIRELLALPPHGERGAPSLAKRPSNDLWLPGSVW